MLVEELNFGKLAEIIRGTQDEEVKKHIACALGIHPAKDFQDLLDTLTQIRNICAHHYVLWDREFVCDALSSLHVTGLVPLSGTCETYDLRLYSYLLIIAHIVRVLSPQTSWCNRLVNHLRTATPEQRQAMGFPKGSWHTALERDPHSVR